MEAELITLGTSAAAPTPSRGLPALLLRYKQTLILMDCGEGAQLRLVQAGYGPSRLTAVLVTHCHGDHIYGLPGLLASMHMVGGRRGLLTIVGPPCARSYVEAALESTGMEPSFPIHYVDASTLLDSPLPLPGGLTVRALRVEHPAPTGAYAYLLEAPGRVKVDLEAARRLGLEPGPLLGRLARGERVRVAGRIVEPSEVVRRTPPLRVLYTGDTAPLPREWWGRLAPLSVVVHDSTFDSTRAREAHEQGHSTPRDAAEAAVASRAELLVLTHFSARYEDVEFMEVEAARIVGAGRVVAAEDLTRIPLR